MKRADDISRDRIYRPVDATSRVEDIPRDTILAFFFFPPLIPRDEINSSRIPFRDSIDAPSKCRR